MIPPRSTYRLQFRNGMDFGGARGLLPYLERLGISHLYASPLMTAVGGSTHGYDVTHANEIDPALGGLDGLRALSEDLHGRGMGLILDIVPNHMAADGANPFWMDALEFGETAQTAATFDIDFTKPIALPWLGDDVTEAIEALRFDAAAGRIEAIVASNGVPLRPSSVAMLLDRIGEREACPSLDLLLYQRESGVGLV